MQTLVALVLVEEDSKEKVVEKLGNRQVLFRGRTFDWTHSGVIVRLHMSGSPGLLIHHRPRPLFG